MTSFDREFTSVSPTRQYVVVASKSDGSGFYFRSFTLPETTTIMTIDGSPRNMGNNAAFAHAYYDVSTKCAERIEMCIPLENFFDFQNVDQLAAERERKLLEDLHLA